MRPRLYSLWHQAKRWRHSAVFWVLLTTFCTAITIQTGNLGSSDAGQRLQVTHSLWTDDPEILPEDPQKTAVYGKGLLRAPYGLGQSLLMLPADILGTAVVRSIHPAPAMERRLRQIIVAYATFPLLTVAIVATAYALLRRLDFSDRDSAIGSLTFLLATTLMHWSQVHQENSLLLFLMLFAILHGLRWTACRSLLSLSMAGIACGFSLLVRPTAVLTIAASGAIVAAALFYSSKTRFWPRLILAIATVCIWLIVFVGFDRIYHFHRFGDWTNSYASLAWKQHRQTDPLLPPNWPMTTPFPDGFFGALFGPEKSVFLYDPLLLILIAASIASWNTLSRTLRWTLAIGGLTLLAQLAVHARLEFWSGDAAWGNRYASIPVLFLTLFAVPVALRYHANRSLFHGRSLLWTIVGVSVVIQIASTALPSHIEMAQRHQSGGHMFVIGQRFKNVAALASAKSTPAGATSVPATAANGASWNYMPFNLGKYFSPRLFHLFVGLWCLQVLVCAALVWVTLDRIRKSDGAGENTVRI